MRANSERLSFLINEAIQTKYKDRYGEEFCKKMLVLKVEHILCMVNHHNPELFKILENQFTSGAV